MKEIKFDKYDRKGAYHWRDFDDDELYRQHVLFVIDWIKEDNILDVGAGDGFITHKLGCKGIDISEIAVKLAQEKGVDVSIGDVYTVKGNYDAVYLGDVLEHLLKPAKAIKNLSNITNKIYITTPYRKEQIGTYHYREWRPLELVEYMRRLGWRNISIEVINDKIYGIFIKDKSVFK